MSSNKDKSSRRIDRKRQQLRQRLRRDDLNEMFDKKRKEIEMDTQNELNKQYIQSSDQTVINQCIYKITNNQSYSQAVDTIWKICIMGLKTRLLTKDNIALLSTQFVKLAQRQMNNTNHQKELMMLSWIIGNWCFYFNDLPKQMYEMVQVQIGILAENNTSVKFSQLIIQHFTNTCCNEPIRVRLLQNSIISKIVNCRVYQDRESDKSTFLSNFIYNLPYRYKISAQCKDNLIFYLKSTFQISKLDYILRLDSILIISKLLIINEGSYHRDVVLNLQENIRLYIYKLEDDIKFQSLQDILELLIRLYKRRDYNQNQSFLYSQQMYQFIWKVIQEHIIIKMQQYDQKIQAVQNQIWDFIYEFCQINSQTIQIIVKNLYDRCLSKEIGDYEQRVVKILIKSYHHYDEQTLQFWGDELIELHSDQYICIDLLNIVKKCLANNCNPQLLLVQNQRLKQLLNKLIFNQVQEIAKLSYEIVHFHNENTMLEQQSTKGANKSFNTVCQVLSTPLQVKTNTHSLRQQPSKFTAIEEYQ